MPITIRIVRAFLLSKLHSVQRLLVRQEYRPHVDIIRDVSRAVDDQGADKTASVLSAVVTVIPLQKKSASTSGHNSNIEDS